MKLKKGKYINLLICLFLFLILFSCTLSFTNISTNGKAADVVDENLKSEAEVNPDISVPLKL